MSLNVASGWRKTRMITLMLFLLYSENHSQKQLMEKELMEKEPIWKKLSFSMLLVNFTNHDYLLVVKRQLNLWKINWKKKKTFQKTRILLVPQVLVPLPVPLSGILRSKLWQTQKSFRCLMSFPTTAPKTPAEIKVNCSLLCSKMIAVFFVWKHQMWICY